MKKIMEILETFKGIADNPDKALQEYLKKGEKVVGCFPGYCPEEIIYAHGAIPMGMWGGNVKANAVKKYLPSFYCNILQECLELSIKGAYSGVSGILVPCLCDSLKAIGQNLKIAVPDIAFIPLVHPQNRTQGFALDYLQSEYKEVSKQLEEITGVAYAHERLNEAIIIYNDHRKTMRNFLDYAKAYGHIITPYYRHKIVKSSYFIDKKVHTNLLKELENEIINQVKVKKMRPVGLVGIMLDSDEILHYMNELDMGVGFDELLHESRQFRADCDLYYEDGLKNLCTRWQKTSSCSLLFDVNKTRIDLILENVRRYNLSGIIISNTTFCDPEDYDMPFLRHALSKNNIPFVVIEVDDKDSMEKTKTKLLTFSEIIGMEE